MVIEISEEFVVELEMFSILAVRLRRVRVSCACRTSARIVVVHKAGTATPAATSLT
jgi:hypothetical protein